MKQRRRKHRERPEPRAYRDGWPRVKDLSTCDRCFSIGKRNRRVCGYCGEAIK